MSISTGNHLSETPVRPLLDISNLSVSYGPIPALTDVSLQVRRGEIVLLGGANGAGKSTLLRAVSGLLAPRSGAVRFEDQVMTGWAPARVARAGLRHVPEGRRIWPNLTVHEHLELAWRLVPGEARRRLREQITTLFPRLAERWNQNAGSMSGGEQQMLAIARGLAGDPKLLMIDELSLGLAPAIARQLFAALRRINSQGVTILIVEQALHQALELVHRGFILETGRLVAQGPPEVLRNNSVVQRAYLAI